jgi:hypothetical protein
MGCMRRSPFHCRAKWIGAEARRLLSGPGFSGQVLAVVSKTIYLESSRGEVLWVVKGNLPMHRRSLLAPFPISLFSPGENFLVRDSKLYIEDKTIGFDQVREWNPESTERQEAVPLMSLEKRLQRLRTAIQTCRRHEAYGQDVPVRNCGASGMMDVAQACLARDQTLAAQKARSLIGLGSGLTPSGDDFTGGLLFAFHILQKTYPEEFNGDREAITDLIEWAKEQTNPISHTILSDLAIGQGPEPLHGLVNELLKSGDLEASIAHVTRLIEIGSTSGCDMLAGFMTGMLLIEGRWGGGFALAAQALAQRGA